MITALKVPLSIRRLLGRYDFVIAGALVLATFIIWPSPPTQYDNYSYLASAFVNARVDIADWPGRRVDAQFYNGKYYIIEGPVPALLMVPAALFGGTNTDQRSHCVVFAAVAAALLWRLLGRLGAEGVARAALFVFFIAGTSFYWCAMYGDVWFFAHVAAVLFTFAALLELTGSQRAWLVSLYAVLAVFSRFSMLMAVPVYAAYLIACAPPERRRRIALGFAAPLLAGAAWYVWYSYARWGVPYDIGYSLWFHQDIAGKPTGPPFRFSNLGYQLWSFFVLAPARYPRGFPYLIPMPLGVALTWTSPALVYAFLARRPKPLVIALWSATVLVMIPSLLYYVNGFVQFGMRHALDFEPYLISLMALAAAGKRMPWWTYVLLSFSIAVGIWGIVFWRTFWRP